MIFVSLNLTLLNLTLLTMAQATFWDPFGILGAVFNPEPDTPAHVRDAGRQMVTDGNNSAKPRRKKLYFGRESMVPDDYVPPPPVHPVVFDGKVGGREVSRRYDALPVLERTSDASSRQLHVRNFSRHFACYSPSGGPQRLFCTFASGFGNYRSS